MSKACGFGLSRVSSISILTCLSLFKTHAVANRVNHSRPYSTTSSVHPNPRPQNCLLATSQQTTAVIKMITAAPRRARRPMVRSKIPEAFDRVFILPSSYQHLNRVKGHKHKTLPRGGALSSSPWGLLKHCHQLQLPLKEVLSAPGLPVVLPVFISVLGDKSRRLLFYALPARLISEPKVCLGI